ncbi:MAG: lysylphosphatidylglycerol synthase domain-containing protein [Thermaurantiacus sp.]
MPTTPHADGGGGGGGVHPRFAGIAGWLRAHANWLTGIVIAAVVTLAVFALSELLRDVTMDEILAALTQITARQILLSIALTALSYFVLTFYDVLALHTIGSPRPYRYAALGGFSAYALSHNMGFAPVTGGTARWRAYRGSGLPVSDIARIVVIAGVTLWLGIFLMLGLFLVLVPGTLRVQEAALPYALQAMLGLVVLLGIAFYLFACWRRIGPLSIFGWRLPVPTLRQAAMQFLLAAADISLASAALLVLLPGATLELWPSFLVAYVVAIVVAFISHAPGGIGVFEAVILVTLPQVDKASMVSALILYRAIYYWLPFLVALLFLFLNEVRLWRKAKEDAPVQIP